MTKLQILIYNDKLSEVRLPFPKGPIENKLYSV